jgi:hypothetical protein
MPEQRVPPLSAIFGVTTTRPGSLLLPPAYPLTDSLVSWWPSALVLAFPPAGSLSPSFGQALAERRRASPPVWKSLTGKDTRGPSPL